MIDRIDQHRHTERVGKQNELLPLVVAFLAGRGEELDAGKPLGFGQLDLAHERMQVPDEAGP